MDVNAWILVSLHMILMVQTIEDALASKAGCDSPLGMQSGAILNAQIRASSSQHYQYSPPHAARLFNTRTYVPFSFGAWCSKHRNLHQHLLIDFLTVKNITGISSQGLRLAGQHWVSSYSVSYSCDGRFWQPYKPGGNTKIFDANSNTDSVVRNNFTAPITARMLRLHPITWHHWGSICARIEIHGCDSSRVCTPTSPPTSPPPRTTRRDTTAHARTFSTRPVMRTTTQSATRTAPTKPACTNPLGMEDYRIKDSQITASSFKNSLTHPSSGRLNNRMKSAMSFGSWCASTADKQQYLQVDLLSPTTVVAIATQGMANPEGNWVTSYQVSYSCDGGSWYLYEHYGKKKIFRGNSDSQSTVKHYLEKPLTARLVRLRAVTWNALGEICLRMELYGCNSSKVCTKGNTSESIRPSTTTKPPQEPHTSRSSLHTIHSKTIQDWAKPTNQTRATKQKNRIVIIYKEIENDDVTSCSARGSARQVYLFIFTVLYALACVT